AFARERLLEHPADRAIVVDDPYGARIARAFAERLYIHVHGPSPFGAHESGSSTLNTVRPGALVHSIVPPCCAISVCAIVSPRPLPPSRPETSGKKIRSLIAWGTPGPLSSIAIATASRCRRFASVTLRATRVTILIAGAGIVLAASACAALRTMLSDACMSCS